MVSTNTWISTMKVPAQCLCIRHQTLQMKYVLYQPEAPQKMERRWAPPNVSAQRKGYGQWTQKKVLDRSIQAPITNLYRSVSRLTTTARLIGKRQEVEDAPMSSFAIHYKDFTPSAINSKLLCPQEGAWALLVPLRMKFPREGWKTKQKSMYLSQIMKTTKAEGLL